MSAKFEGRDGVIVAVDPHKASWTAVAVTAELTAAEVLRVPATRGGYLQLRRFAAQLAAGAVGDRGCRRVGWSTD